MGVNQHKALLKEVKVVPLDVHSLLVFLVYLVEQGLKSSYLVGFCRKLLKLPRGAYDTQNILD